MAARLRASYREPVLEPASLEIANWGHTDYTALWERVIERFADRVVLMSGWHFSRGCALEAQKALQSGLRLATPDGSPISLDCAIEQLHAAASNLAHDDVPVQVGDVALTLDEFRSSLKGRTAPVKYRNKSGNAWAGRGARPVWLREKLKAGAKLEDFAVHKKPISRKKSKKRRKAKR
jgi:H-NS histone C-terminal domain